MAKMTKKIKGRMKSKIKVNRVNTILGDGRLVVRRNLTKNFNNMLVKRYTQVKVFMMTIITKKKKVRQTVQIRFYIKKSTDSLNKLAKS